MIHKSKCKFCVEGMVLNDDCTKTIGHYYCDIDQYDEEIGCGPNCHGYSKGNRSETKRKRKC